MIKWTMVISCTKLLLSVEMKKNEKCQSKNKKIKTKTDDLLWELYIYLLYTKKRLSLIKFYEGLTKLYKFLILDSQKNLDTQ